jgi:acetyl esterase/lipase
MHVDRWFLGTSLLGALNTANAYRPLRRKGYGGVLAFMTGQPTSEAPLATLAAQAVAAAGFAACGGLRTPAGKAALAVNAASWAALAGLHVEARRVGGVLDGALADGLGPGYRGEVPPETADEPPLTITQMTLPRFGNRKAFRASRGVAYGDAGPAHHLDVWRAADLPSDARAPVVVQVHGGGWVIGAKEVQGEVLLSEMARRGWVGVSINYRLSPRATWPDQIVDVKRALAWVKEHIAEHGGDPGFVAITGGSAGGHLTALAALTPSEPAFQPGFESSDTTVQAAVPFYGVYDVADLAGTGRREIVDLWERSVMKQRSTVERDRWEQACPITHVLPDAPPMFVLHGTNDTLVPVEQARTFVERLRAVSRQPVVYAELPGAQHGFELFASTRAHHTVRAVARFLEVTRTRARFATAAPTAAAEALTTGT